MKETSRLKMWLAVFAIFFLGLGIGVAGTGLVVRHRVLAALHGGAGKNRELFTHFLVRELHLTDAQKPRVEEAIETAQHRFFEIRHAHQPELTAVVDDLYHSLQKEVPADHAAKLDELYRTALERLTVDPFIAKNAADPARP